MRFLLCARYQTNHVSEGFKLGIEEAGGDVVSAFPIQKHRLRAHERQIIHRCREHGGCPELVQCFPNRTLPLPALRRVH